MSQPTQVPIETVPRWRRIVVAAIGWIASLTVLALAAGIALAYAWPIDDSATGDRGYGRVVLALFYARVFQMHVGLAALAATLVVWLTRRWRSAIACTIASAALLAPYARDYVPKRPPPVASRTLRVMSLNLFAFNHDAASILNAIEREDPDVIVACEVTKWSEREVFAKLADRYPKFVHPDYDGGAAVLSRAPFRRDAAGPAIGGRRPLLFDLDGRTFAMYPVHLTSPGHRSHLMMNRLQTRQLAQIAARETRPTMIVGDCNFTQTTPQYMWLRAAGLRSTHDLVGFGIGTTWGPKWHPRLNRLPGVRIDQMMLSRELTATEHHVGLYTGSDHLPIVATVGFAASP